MLPYPSYLRVYEPAEVLGAEPSGGPGVAERVTATVASEQHVALVSTVWGPRASGGDRDLPDVYALVREGREYLCPVDMPLRSWLSLGSLAEAIGDAAASLMVPAETRAQADAEFLAWRRDHPTAVPHIRQATWGVPRAWFLLVVEDERETYDAVGHPGVRYRARISDARRRLARAQTILGAVIDDLELHEELADVESWLDAFDDQSWVELDYAGVAQLLGPALADDQSARDVHTALRALRRGDFAAAGIAYRRFEDRWRVVNAFERAN